MNNIFQGNDLILECIAESLGYKFDKDEDDFKYGWFTKDIYFQAFFYLTNRFGSPMDFDDYKTAGTWNFKVKDFIIQITFRSSDLEIVVYGEKWHNHGGLTEHNIKRQRLDIKNSDRMLHIDFKNDKITWNPKYVNSDEVRRELSKSNSFEWLWKYNDKVCGIDKMSISDKPYQNAYTRRALKTLSQFLHNMLTSIYVRDCAFNIKGRCDGEFDKYVNNIDIKPNNNA